VNHSIIKAFDREWVPVSSSIASMMAIAMVTDDSCAHVKRRSQWAVGRCVRAARAAFPLTLSPFSLVANTAFVASTGISARISTVPCVVRSCVTVPAMALVIGAATPRARHCAGERAKVARRAPLRNAQTWLRTHLAVGSNHQVSQRAVGKHLH